MKKTFFDIIKRFIIMTFGVAITSFAISTFLTPNKLVLGGAAGIATILYYTFNVPQGLTFGIFNAVFLLLSAKILGRKFTINTIIGSALLSLFVELFSYLPPLTENVLLATLFGGVLYGFGIGIAFSVECSTGGMDIIGRLIQHFLPHIQVGKILWAVNGVIIAISYFVFNNTELILFSVLALFVSTFTIDWLISALNISVIAFVITDKGEEISKLLGE